MIDLPILFAQRGAPRTDTGFLGIFVVLAFYVFLFVIIYVPTSLGMSKLFQKAGRPGGPAWVPIYRYWVTYELAGKPGWWSLIWLIPCVGGIIYLVCAIIGLMEFAKRFGKDPVYGVGLALLAPIFFPILGFSDARYRPLRSRDRYDEEDDYDDRPRRRRPADEDEEEEERPRRRRPAAEEDDEDRPRRRRRVEDDE